MRLPGRVLRLPGLGLGLLLVLALPALSQPAPQPQPMDGGAAPDANTGGSPDVLRPRGAPSGRVGGATRSPRSTTEAGGEQVKPLPLGVELPETKPAPLSGLVPAAPRLG